MIYLLSPGSFMLKHHFPGWPKSCPRSPGHGHWKISRHLCLHIRVLEEAPLVKRCRMVLLVRVEKANRGWGQALVVFGSADGCH